MGERNRSESWEKSLSLRLKMDAADPGEDSLDNPPRFFTLCTENHTIDLTEMDALLNENWHMIDH